MSLRIAFTRRADGDVVLRCERADGSATWQRRSRHAHFFSFHDLTHFAVETTLGFRMGFYGLLAAGWDMTDTEGKGKRGPIPAEAILVEHIVGLFAGEQAGGAPPLSAADFNVQLGKMAATMRVFTDSELNAVRSRITELHDKWAAVGPGSTFELEFDPS